MVSNLDGDGTLIRVVLQRVQEAVVEFGRRPGEDPVQTAIQIAAEVGVDNWETVAVVPLSVTHIVQ